jgi:DNA-binding PadR family transcriptional regulator
MVLRNLILGMLAIAPMTGYSLKKHFDASVNHFWAADKAQIYRTLRALVADGLASITVVPQAGYPDRHEHQITEAGRTSLEEWLRSPLDPEETREPFLARLFFAGALGRDEVTMMLAKRRAQAQEMRRALVEQHERVGSGLPADLGVLTRVATLRNGLAHVDAELAWLDDTERMFRS